MGEHRSAPPWRTVTDAKAKPGAVREGRVTQGTPMIRAGAGWGRGERPGVAAQRGAFVPPPAPSAPPPRMRRAQTKARAGRRGLPASPSLRIPPTPHLPPPRIPPPLRISLHSASPSAPHPTPHPPARRPPGVAGGWGCPEGVRVSASHSPA